MADPISILTRMGKMVLKIRETVNKVRDNREECRLILEFVGGLDAVVTQLKQKPEIMEDKETVDIIRGHLEGSLKRASDYVAEWQTKKFLRHAIEAGNAVKELARVYRDISARLQLADITINIFNTTLLTRILEKLDDLPNLLHQREATAAVANNRRTNVPGETSGDKMIPRLSSCLAASKRLEIYPLELLFSLEPNKQAAIICPVTLTNRTDSYVGIWMEPTNQQFTCPSKTVMEPYSTVAVPVTMHKRRPLQDRCKFKVRVVVVQSKDDLAGLEPGIRGKLMNRNSKVYWEELTAITCEQARCQYQIVTRSIENVTCTDVHPSKTWMVTGHSKGHVSIWDYQLREGTAMEWQVPTTRVCSTKFIAQEKWLVVGDGDGCVHVYSYTDDAKLYVQTTFRAYTNGDSVDLLALHPIQTYLLSSSNNHRKIMLWDWRRDWQKIQEFNVNTDECVRSLKFIPRANGSFPCVTFTNRAQVWQSTRSSAPIITLERTFRAHHFTKNHQIYVATLGLTHERTELRAAPRSQIWDLGRRKVVHTLGVAGRQMRDVACHPTLPILATSLDDGTICFWDTRTWRLEKMVHITNSLPRALKFYEDINGLRLYVRFSSIITMLEVKLPISSSSQRTDGWN